MYAMFQDEPLRCVLIYWADKQFSLTSFIKCKIMFLSRKSLTYTKKQLLSGDFFNAFHRLRTQSKEDVDPIIKSFTNSWPFTILNNQCKLRHVVEIRR